jgi:hypothetical protein
MATWESIPLVTDAGEKVMAQAPVIVSASRATDLPAFYADWFFERLKKGYVKWRNPFNGKSLYVSFEKMRAIVFWSKNPAPLLKHLDELEARGVNYYIQYTLNDYEAEGWEPRVPALSQRIDTFRKLSERIGKSRVVWRFDPLLISTQTPVERLLQKVAHLGDVLAPYTEKLVFSFADIESYRNVKRNLIAANIQAHEGSLEEKMALAAGIATLNQAHGWGLTLATCAEELDLADYGIEHNRCIDDQLLMRCFPEDDVLMHFLGFERNLFGELQPIGKRLISDKGQRKACGCIISKDIGEYNTCPHQCVYCYANTSPECATQNALKANRTDSIRG